MATHKLISSRSPASGLISDLISGLISGVPVFLYHDICAASTRDRYSLPLVTFREHLSFLSRQNFAVEDLSALAVAAAANIARRVVLTFDDGLSSNYERAFPALLEHGFTATFFVTNSLLGTPGYLTSPQLREMSAAGMSFGSHGLEHIDYSGLAPAIAQRELQCSRQSLEDALGKPISAFAAPYGFMGRSLISAVQQAGFQQLCSSNPWLASPGSTVVSRLAIYCGTDLPRFSALAVHSPLPLLARATRNALLYLPKHILLRLSPQRLGVQVKDVKAKPVQVREEIE
jgi:peptidoglycan/xylan/chitin deacetylase (PgdA/CDA1 family)